jgi:putative membrane protein
MQPALAMIERYSDHAANERTFLAWVRTAIAIMAFGFLVQKFDLFLKIAGEPLASRSLRAVSAGGEFVGTIAGLLLIILGGAMMVLAAIRFRRTSGDIDAVETRPGPGTRLDIALVMFRDVAAAARDNPLRLSGVHANRPVLSESAPRSHCRHAPPHPRIAAMSRTKEGFANGGASIRPRAFAAARSSRAS